jgi:hypothetical protein
MDLDNKKTNFSSFFQILSYMNDLDLTQKGFYTKSEFGFNLGYLMQHPLKYWPIPGDKQEKEILCTWIKKVYAQKDDKILHHMIEDIIYKVISHEELYATILNHLKLEQNMKCRYSNTDCISYFLYGIKTRNF